MTNTALLNNPPQAGRTITTGGSDWLWAVFAVMLLSDLLVIFWTATRPRGTRVFHHIAIAILTTATIAYFSMASDLGDTGVVPEFGQRNLTRAIWYVRYIMWFITAPLLLLELFLSSGLPLSDMLITMFMAIVAVVAGLIGALVPSSYKWGYYAFGIFAYFYILYHLLHQGGRATALTLGVDVRGPYMRSALWLGFIWMLYPIAWGVSEGSNTISPNGEMIFYGVLDILSKPVFLLFFLMGIRNLDHSRFGLYGGKTTEMNSAGGPGMMGRGGAGVTGAGVGPVVAGAGPGVGRV